MNNSGRLPPASAAKHHQISDLRQGETVNAGIAVMMFITAYGSAYTYVFVKRPPTKRYPYRLLKRR